MKKYKIAVAGTGYVGLSLSVLLAQHSQVMAVDIVQTKVDMINNHKSPIQDVQGWLICRFVIYWECELPLLLETLHTSPW